MLVFGLALNALILLLACVGMMVVFLGGGSSPTFLPLLLALALPFSAVCILLGWAWFVRHEGWRRALPAMWQHVPHWLLAALALAIALIVCGELALYVTLVLSDDIPRLWQHLPLLAGLFSAMAFAALESLRLARRIRQ